LALSSTTGLELVGDRSRLLVDYLRFLSFSWVNKMLLV